MPDDFSSAMPWACAEKLASALMSIMALSSEMDPGSSLIELAPHVSVIDFNASMVTLPASALMLKSPNSTVVFKIDVEGYEPKVMSGMTKLVAQSKDVLGLIEFNSTFIGQTGANPEEYLSYLKNHFSIVALPHKSEYKVLEEVSLDVLSDITGNKEVELDLALLSNKNLIHVLEKASE